MAKRSHEDWAALIKQQPASGLTIKAFCRQHKLSIISFYARKSNKVKTVTPFVKATVATPTSLTTQAQPCNPQVTICLQHQTGLWTFPSTLPASYLLEINQASHYKTTT
jgi:putative transposase